MFFISEGISQNNMVMHLNNGTKIYIPLQSIDSIRFQTSPPPSKQNIYQNNGNIISVALTNIDSITYTIPMVGTLPVVTTSAVNVLSPTSAFGGGYVISDGGSKVVQRGVCWNTLPNPTIANNITKDSSGLGSYGSTFQPLVPNTKYYLRAYATNANGTSYGSQITFVTTTAVSGSIPTVSTNAVNYQDSLSVRCGGNISSDGGLVVTARGVCLAVGKTPTINNYHTVDGNGAGNFAGTATGLLPNTNYFIRAYATNDAGTAYGNTFSFTTKDFATVNSDSVFQILSTSVKIAGTIKSDGGISSTSRGVCWSYSKLPTIKSNIKNAGNGNGSFVCTLTGLLKDTIYYARAYASNGCGTTYGKEISFRTQNGKIIIHTDSVFGILSSSALVATNITSDGGDSVKLRGICWSTKANPSINDNKTSDGKSYGTLFRFLLNLTKDTVYYVRAYAQNNTGISYGEIKSFKAKSPGGFLSKKGVGATMDGYQYKTIVTGNGQEWFAENLRTTKFANGQSIPNVADYNVWQNLTTPAWVYYNNDSTLGKTYGKLYHWYTVTDSRNICPYGWHVPTTSEWDSLISFMGGIDSAGGKLKSKGTAYWSSPNLGATDIIGFGALPGGYRESVGTFYELGERAVFWTPSAQMKQMYFNAAWLGEIGWAKGIGMSVRCMRN